MPIAEVKAQWLVLGLFEDESGLPPGLEGTGLAATIERLLSAKEVSGSLGELTAAPRASGHRGRPVLLVGLGPRAASTPGPRSRAGVAAPSGWRARPRERRPRPAERARTPEAVASAMVEG